MTVLGTTTSQSMQYQQDEKVLCFHGPLIYQAKVRIKRPYNTAFFFPSSLCSLHPHRLIPVHLVTCAYDMYSCS